MEPAPKLRVEQVSAWYGDVRALRDVSLTFRANAITVLLGPSGCGKSTLLRCLNRMLDTRRGARMEGRVLFDGEPPPRRQRAVTELRRKFGVIAQHPDPFPKSIRDNLAYGPKVHRLARDKTELDSLVRRSLMRVGLWQELRDELDARATDLSLGQQQRLCIARALAYEPEVLLMDEPCSQLDAANTRRVEDLALSLRNDHTVIWATHHKDTAQRIADDVALFEGGALVEWGAARELWA